MTNSFPLLSGGTLLPMRNALLFLVVASLVAFAKPGNQAEAVKVMEGFFAGTVGVNQALNRLQYLGEERYAASEVLLALPRTTDARRREMFFDFLSQLNVREPELERAFLGALQSDQVGEVMAGSRGLAKLKSASAVNPLIQNLAHPMLGVRRETAKALGQIGKPTASKPLLAAAKVEADLDVKVLMISNAGRAGDKKQAPALEALLKDSSEATRMAAAQGLCALGVPKCAQFANQLLASADKNERFSAVMLFEGTTAKVAGPVLVPVLADPDPKLRARAARILVQGGDATRLDWLVIESAKAQGEQRLVYEDELEKLRVTDEQRQSILKKAGLQ